MPYEVSQNNEFDNLILLCLNHHNEVHKRSDLTRDKYPPEILKGLREKRYKWVNKKRFELELDRIEDIEIEPVRQLGYLFANLIPIQIPKELACLADTKFRTYNDIYDEAKKKKLILPPFILKETQFITTSKIETLENCLEIKYRSCYNGKSIENIKSVFEKIKNINDNIECIYLTVSENTKWKYRYKLITEEFGHDYFELLTRDTELERALEKNLLKITGVWDKLLEKILKV